MLRVCGVIRNVTYPTAGQPSLDAIISDLLRNKITVNWWVKARQWAQQIYTDEMGGRLVGTQM
jgi:hypothetical protein